MAQKSVPSHGIVNMGRLYIGRTRINVADDDLGFLMLYHLLIRILFVFSLIGCLSSYTKSEGQAVPSYSLCRSNEPRLSFSAFTCIQFSVTTLLMIVDSSGCAYL